MGAEKKTIKGKENNPPRKRGVPSATSAAKKSTYLTVEEEDNIVILLGELIRMTDTAVPSRIVGLIIATLIPPDKRRSNNKEKVNDVFTGKSKEVWVPSPSWVTKFVAKHKLYSESEKRSMNFWGGGIQSARSAYTFPGLIRRTVERNPHIRTLSYEMVRAIAECRDDDYKSMFFPLLLKFVNRKGENYFDENGDKIRSIALDYVQCEGLSYSTDDYDDDNSDDDNSDDDNSDDDNSDDDNSDDDN
ncbi:hypothetical protein TRVA0_002S03950 [Trichomonascus vanleenenianus]|uniref:uncharacterized protein n=1 Tax=Trichomonascus vanleenenianus TaxID=2268995 RepID=UPI003ECAB527